MDNLINIDSVGSGGSPEPTNVYEYYLQMLEVLPETDQPEFGLNTFPLDSVCGIACKDIIDKAVELLKLCDPHRDVVYPIRKGVSVAIAIVCFG